MIQQSSRQYYNKFLSLAFLVGFDLVICRSSHQLFLQVISRTFEHERHVLVLESTLPSRTRRQQPLEHRETMTAPEPNSALVCIQEEGSRVNSSSLEINPTTTPRADSISPPQTPSRASTQRSSPSTVAVADIRLQLKVAQAVRREA